MENHINIPSDEPIFSISTAAKLVGVSVQTLRLYEREGLIIPYRKKSNQRLFSQDDVKRIRCIRNTINKKKISLNGIKSLYALVPCWEIVKCSEDERDVCPAYIESFQPCWSYSHSSNICSTRDCRQCEVYRGIINCIDVKSLIRKIGNSHKFKGTEKNETDRKGNNI